MKMGSIPGRAESHMKVFSFSEELKVSPSREREKISVESFVFEKRIRKKENKLNSKAHLNRVSG
jgi:hypothetical protein